MRKLTTIATCLIAALAATAQQRPHTWSVTPKVGLTNSNFTKDIPGLITITGAKDIHSEGIQDVQPDDRCSGALVLTSPERKFGLTLGVEAQYQFSNVFGLSLGIDYAEQGCKYNVGSIDVTYLNDKYKEYGHVEMSELKTSYNTINVPIMANFYVWKGLAVKVGLEPQFTVKREAVSDIKTSGYDKEAGRYLGAEGETIGLKNLSLAAPVGLSYEHSHIVADLRYHIGLTNIAKPEEYRPAKVGMLSLTVGYKFNSSQWTLLRLPSYLRHIFRKW